MNEGAFEPLTPDAQADAGLEQRPPEHPFEKMCRLVPSSGLQFIDTALEAAHLPMLRAWFTEDVIEGTNSTRRVLLPLSADHTSDGTIWHPLTFKPLGPSETLSFSGLEAVEPFLDTWIPVPFLRYLGVSENGEARFDQGPANWARVFLAKPAEGLRGADRIHAVFAFDTRLDLRSRADQSPYLAPNSDDALFASTFMLAVAPNDLSDFLNQPWIDTWLRDACRAHTLSVQAEGIDETGFAPAEEPAGAFEQAHIARYLTFLKILKRLASPPQIRFVDSISKTLPAASTAMDLVIDFGATETTALLIPRNQNRDAEISLAARNAIPLDLRDLSQPAVIHRGPVPTVVEFDNQTFGHAALSRRSGRTDAFAWSSLVRIGHEAHRLSLRANATGGITGQDGLLDGLDQTDPSESVWRFSSSDAGPTKAGRMVTGEAMRHMSESGDVTGRNNGLLSGPGSETAAVVRPRFSHSALVGFFVVELLLHAISEINSANPGNPFAASAPERNDIRQIERIIVTTPVAMELSERRHLVDRVNTAIDLIWRTQQWDAPSNLVHPGKPQLALGIGADVGLQLVYLFSEVRNKFGGSFTDLVDCVRRRTGDPDARDSLRISSLELSRRSAGLTVIDFDVAHDGSIQAGLVLADRTGNGGDQVINAICDAYVVPAIEKRLTACGLSADDAADFVHGYLAGADDANGTGMVHSNRLLSKVIRPAASGLFNAFANMPSRGAEGARRYRFDQLVAAGGGRLEPVAAHFEEAAQQAGAANFALGPITLELARMHIARLIQSELWPMVDVMTNAVLAAESDLLLMGGDLAHLPGLLDHILAQNAVPAGRVVERSMPTPEVGITSAPSAQDATPHQAALLAAYMASRNMLITEGFYLGTGGITQALANEAPSPAILQNRPKAAPASEEAIPLTPANPTARERGQTATLIAGVETAVAARSVRVERLR